MTENRGIILVKSEIEKILSSLDKEIFDHKEKQYLSFGKGMRSKFAFLLGEAMGIPEEKSLALAVCAEIVHNASLLHDDCVDAALLRRGKPTLNSVLGVNKAILLGDLSMALAFKKAEELSCEISSQLVFSVRKMAEGALLEENFKNNIITREQYRKMVSGKTSALFRWISLSSAFFSKTPNFEAAAHIAENFGMMFQITDDVIDIENCGDSGKDCLKDLMEGKCSFPLIIALEDKKFSAKNEHNIKDFFSSELKDYAMAYNLAEEIKKGGFVSAARKEAEKITEEMKNYIFTMPNSKAASEFYAFAYGLCSRKY
ncbi:MAG: polyprenyl synthetase family protein [Elusimicrobia bacterium]|nr:polyprenyl synthetase family protein [Elusimicrobiota bacterium]